MSAAEVVSVRTPHRRAWWRLLRSELRLIFGRRRNQMGLLVLAGLVVVMAVAIKLSDSGKGTGGGDPMSSVTSNGLFLAFGALGIEITLFLPLAIAMLAGDAIAGEANIGTLRYILTVPVNRTRLLAVKAASLVIGAFTGTALVAVTGIVAGVGLFGTGPLTTMSGNQISLWAALGRLALAVVYLGVGMSALAMLGLFVSTLTEQPIAATVAVMTLAMVFWVLDQVPQLDWLHPWLLVDRWQSFLDLLRDPIYTGRLWPGLAVDLAYGVVFWLAAWLRFRRKDITS